MEELNRKIAEWVGFEFKSIHDIPSNNCSYTVCDIFVNPNDAQEFVSDFTTSLDACFKYVVPKLKEPYITFYKDGCSIWSMDKGGRCVVAYSEENNPALAFCKAVEKLIDKEA